MADGHDHETLIEISADEIAAIRARAEARRAAAAGDGRVQAAPAEVDSKVQLNARVPARLKNRLIAHARATNTDISGVVAAALDVYLLWRRTP